jgi:heptosyltransferase-2
MTDSLHTILIVRFSSVGDIVLSSLLVRTLRNRFPGCQLDFCVKKEFADLVLSNPNISRVIEFPTDGGFADLRHLRRQILQKRYDLIVDIHDNLRSRYICFSAGNVVRFRKRKLARFLLVTMKLNAYHRFGSAPSVALRYLEPVRDFGVEDDGNGLELFFDEEVSARVRELVRGSGFTVKEKFVGVCPSARHNTKMWPKERFAEAASTLSKEHNQPIALFGSGDDEVKRCAEIASMICSVNAETKIMNLAGRISLIETAAMMDNCSFVLTNDTGLMHIAAARKRKVVAIFGSTVRELGFFPFGTEHAVVENAELKCRPCSHIGLAKCPKGHFRCMNEILPSHVVSAANSLLSRTHLQ